MFSGKDLVTKVKYRTGKFGSNIQVVKLAIATSLEALEQTDIQNNISLIPALITYNKISLTSFKNVN